MVAPKFKATGYPEYAQGMEVPVDNGREVPEGFETIELPDHEVMTFHGHAYEENQFMKAISWVSEQLERFDPIIYGYQYVLEDGPRFQYEPRGTRQYIESRPVRRIGKK